MNVETAITKKGGNGKVRACTTIHVISKKFSTIEAPDAAVIQAGQKIFSHGIPFSPILFLCSISPTILVFWSYIAHTKKKHNRKISSWYLPEQRLKKLSDRPVF
jgi:hypothetical protein